MKGLIFSIEEFAVFDGAGIRVNVFFKGCPLRCLWCHNPEGLEHKIQIVKNPNGCLHCGICESVCKKDDKCVLCDSCILNCPAHLIRRSGEWIDSDVLAKRLLKYAPILTPSGGGLTFSGGEVLMQPDFLCEILEKTSSMNRVIETSCFGDSEKWKKVLGLVDFVYFDLKIMNPEKHKEYTGVSNELILKNADILKNSGVPFTIRVPFIHNVNTDRDNIYAMCNFIKGASTLQSIELLSYNKLAGAKYKLLGKDYNYEFEQAYPDELSDAVKIIESYDINCTISR